MHRSARRATPALLAVMLLATLAPGRVAAAAEPDPADTQVVGGNEAAPGAWPAQAGILDHADPPGAHPFCGATVLSPSWILTAAHCTTGDDGATARAPSSLDVLAGTQDVTTGGQRRQAVEIRIAPGFDRDSLRDDIALVRLDHPVTAPAMPIVAPGRGIAAGTDLVTTGWGARSADGTSFPARLYEVHVPAIGDTACASAYPTAPDKFFASSMLCAGDLAVGGRDSCSGDSGGPLSAAIGGKAVQVGMVSWGVGCAEAGHPGVYTRLSAFSSWITAQTRYGPFPDAAAFVVQFYRDAGGRAPTLPELFLGVLRVTGSGTVIWSLFQSGSLWYPNGVRILKLYRAAFRRDADLAGLAYWVGRMHRGTSIDVVASALAASPEFQATYGALDNADYVAQLYLNVLGRPADGSGVDFWTSQLDEHRMSRGRVLRGFATSIELSEVDGNRAEVAGMFYVLLRRLPTASEYTTWVGRPVEELLASLLGSVAYAARF